MMKKMLKFLKWAAVVLCGAPILIYLFWLTGNLKNDEINPQLAQLLAQRPSQPLTEKDNAYFDVQGLAAPPNIEPHVWGVSWFMQATANDRLVLEGKPAAPINLSGYPLNGKVVDLPCSHKEARLTCLEEIAQNTAAVQSLLDRESLLLHRFDALLDKDYQEPYREMTPQSELAFMSTSSRATRLAQIRFALNVVRGHDDAALASWEKETAFVLRQARNSHSLIDVLVFTAALNRYEKLLADYISAHPKAARIRAKQLTKMLGPFNKSSISLQHAFESEAAFSARTLLSQPTSLSSEMEESPSFAGKVIDLLSTPLFDKQATANEIANNLLELSRISLLEGDEYRAALAKVAEQQQRAVDRAMSFHYHNPIGRIILAIAASVEYSRYLYRTDVIIANRKLLEFAIDMLSDNARTTTQITSELNARQANMRHPYTGEMPVWNEESRTLSYMDSEQIKANTPPMMIKL